MKINGIAQYDCKSRNYDKNNDHSNVKFGEVKRIVINSEHGLVYPIDSFKKIILESPYIKELAQKYDFDIIIKNVVTNVIVACHITKLTMTIKAPMKCIPSKLAKIKGLCINWWREGFGFYDITTLSNTPAQNPLPGAPQKLSVQGIDGDCTQAAYVLIQRLKKQNPFTPNETRERYYYSLDEVFANRNK